MNKQILTQLRQFEIEHSMTILLAQDFNGCPFPVQFPMSFQNAVKNEVHFMCVRSAKKYLTAGSQQMYYSPLNFLQGDGTRYIGHDLYQLKSSSPSLYGSETQPGQRFYESIIKLPFGEEIISEAIIQARAHMFSTHEMESLIKYRREFASAAVTEWNRYNQPYNSPGSETISANAYLRIACPMLSLRWLGETGERAPLLAKHLITESKWLQSLDIQGRDVQDQLLTLLDVVTKDSSIDLKDIPRDKVMEAFLYNEWRYASEFVVADHGQRGQSHWTSGFSSIQPGPTPDTWADDFFYDTVMKPLSDEELGAGNIGKTLIQIALEKAA